MGFVHRVQHQDDALHYGEDLLVVSFGECGQLGLEGAQDGIGR
ncbi:hypothetical protein ACIQ6K_22990 [Streptomyces sp. NPDC096354]